MLAAAALGVLIGVVLGGLGGGGGVLTVPALVYLLGQPAQDATTSSVVVVGISAVAGVLARARSGSVDWRTAVVFGIAGVPAALLGTLLNRHVAEPVLLLSFAATTLVAAADLDWAVLVPFTLAAVLGTFLGKRVADRLSGSTLRRAFAVLLILVGVAVAVESVVSL
jgi:uncharacterized membrane protein YfcA